MLLAGDVGGTKTDLALFTSEEGPRKPLEQAQFASASYPSLEAMVREFLSTTKVTVEKACFDVAGPVVEGRANVTNLTWGVDEGILKREFGLKSVQLLNDLEAVARSVPLLEPDDLFALNRGERVEGGAIAVIAPGTGLGEAFLTWNGTSYEAQPSEGGHADFSPTDDREIGLLKYLQARYSHVSFERVCSGIGIPNIYDYLRDSGYGPEIPEVEQALAEVRDRTPVIAQNGTGKDAPSTLCRATMEMFLSILGSETSNLALKVLATGGIYLGGGIPRRVLPLFEDDRFLKAFERKGRFNDLLRRMPVRIITNRIAPLIGAAACGLG